jgi:bifunctional non-homologous end joining protein LigD
MQNLPGQPACRSQTPSAPELATLVAAPPRMLSDWIFEVKFDGYGMLARADAGDVRIVSRDGLDWTYKLTRL